MEIRSVGAALIHAYRRTDMTKPICAFRDYANTPVNCSEVLGVEGRNIKLQLKETTREDVNWIHVLQDYNQ
jgi:hypothetical protein